MPCPTKRQATAETRRDEDGDLDELLAYWCGKCWLHVERLNDRDWCVNIGDSLLYAHVTRKGVKVTVVE